MCWGGRRGVRVTKTMAADQMTSLNLEQALLGVWACHVTCQWPIRGPESVIGSFGCHQRELRAACGEGEGADAFL